MRAVRLWLVASAAIVRRDLLVFVSYRSQAASRVVNSIVSAAMFYYISRLVSTEQFMDADDYFAYVVVGLAIMQVLSSTLGSTPMVVRADLISGTLERVLVSPFGVLGAVIAALVFPTALALLTGAITIAFSAVVFGLHIEVTTVAWAIPLSVLASLAFAPFTLGFTAFVLAFKQVMPGSNYVVTALALVSGIYFPVELLPSWIAWFAEVQPFTPAVELLRHVITGAPTSDPVLLLVAKLVGFTVVLGPLSLIAVNRAVEYGRRRGSLIEY